MTRKKGRQKIWGRLKKGRQKILGVPFLKKRSSKKFGDICPKSNNFRHISEIYRLEQSFFRSKKAKKLVFRSINAKNYFLGLIFYFLGL